MTGYTDQEMLKINAEKFVVNIGRQEKKMEMIYACSIFGKSNLFSKN